MIRNMKFARFRLYKQNIDFKDNWSAILIFTGQIGAFTESGQGSQTRV